MKQLSYIKRLLTVLLLLGAIPSVQAQFTATGRVTDAGGEPLPGVSITVTGASRGTATDANGEFRIEIPTSPASLTFGYTGYKSVTVEVSAASPRAEVVMEENFSGLEEVVVSGLATTVKRSNLANAVSSVTSRELTGTTVQSTMDQALYGKVTGVTIITNSGAPGGGTTIKFRGITTLNGNSQPLYIVDGVYYDNSNFRSNTNFVTAAAGQGSTDFQDNPSNRIADLDPEDIERLEVLKGASAAAIYGSRAAAGVVIITTKRGRRDGTTEVSVSQSLGLQTQLRKLGTRDWDENEVRDFYGQDGVNAFNAAKASGNYFDYEDELFGNDGLLSTTRLSLNGGTEKLGYFAGVTRKSEEGIVPNTGYDKTSVRLNLDTKVFSWADFQFGFNYVNSLADRGLFNNDNRSVTMGVSFVATPPWADLHPDERGFYPNNPYAPSNFLQTSALITNNERVNRLLGGGIGTFRLISNDRNSLQLVVRGGVDQYSLETRSIFPRELQFQKGGLGNNGVSIKGNAVSTGANIAAALVHTLTTGGNTTFRSQLGLTQENLEQDFVNTAATQLIGTQTNVSQASSIQAIQERLEQVDRGFFVQEEVNFQDKVVVTLGVRGDKSSRNGDPNKLYYYPKASAAFNIHNVTNLGETVDQLKLRAAFGQSGNFAPFGAIYTPLVPVAIGGNTGSLIGTTRGNPGLEPERQSEIEAGFDLGIFDNLAQLEFTYYVKSITDLILESNTPTSTGFSNYWRNAADLRNTGFEIALDLLPIRQERFNWNSRISFWRNTSEVTRLAVPAFNEGGFGATLGTYRIEEGKSATQLVGIGPDADAGTGLQVFGDAEPDFQMSFLNTFTFGDFQLNALVHWKAGGENINLSSLLSDLSGTSWDYDDTDIDPTGTLSNGAYRLQQLGVSAGAWIEDASYVRLREVGLRYNIPASAFNDRARAYVSVSGRNLLNFFDYHSYDPEVSNFGTRAISSNVEVTPFPTAKSFFVTVGATF